MNSNVYPSLALLVLLAIAAAWPSLAQDSNPNANDAYTIKVDLPQSVVHDLTVTDTLPQGLIYESNSLEIIGTDTAPEETVSSPNDGSLPVTATWDFGQVDNSDDQDIIIRLQPIVADIAPNQDGTTLGPSQVSMQYTDDAGEIYAASGETAPVVLVEPDLEIAMDSEPWDGKNLTCTVSIGHSPASHAEAFDTDLSVILPAGLTYSAGSDESISGPCGEVENANSQEIKWHFGEIDQSWNKDQQIVLKFKAAAEDREVPGEIKAVLGWRSAPAESPQSRSYSKSQSLPVPAYNPIYSIELNLIAEPDPVDAGQAAIYAVNYANTGKDDVHDVTIEETYDTNTIFLAATPMPNSGQWNTWKIGDLPAGEAGSIKVTVVVNSAVADGTVLKNSVRMHCAEDANAEAIAKITVKNSARKKAENVTSNSTNTSTISALNATLNASINSTLSPTIKSSINASINSSINASINSSIDASADSSRNASINSSTISSIPANLSIVRDLPPMEDKANVSQILQQNASDNYFELLTPDSHDSIQGIDVNVNLTEETMKISSFANYTADSLISLNSENIIDIVNDTIESIGVASNGEGASSNENFDESNVNEDEISNSDGERNALDEIADHIKEMEDASGVADKLEITNKIEEEIEKTYTLIFEDDIKIDIIFEKSNPMMESAYVELNETDANSKEGDSGTSDGSDGSDTIPSINMTENSISMINQTASAIGNLLAETIIPDNTSESKYIEPIMEENESSLFVSKPELDYQEPDHATNQNNDAISMLAPVAPAEQQAAEESLPDQGWNDEELLTLLESPTEYGIIQNDINETTE